MAEQLVNYQRDAERFASIADCERVSVNKWLAQVIRGNKWHTCYFADPPGGPAEYKAESALEALRNAIDSSLRPDESEHP